MAFERHLPPVGTENGASRHPLAQAAGDNDRAGVDVHIPILWRVYHMAAYLHVFVYAILVNNCGVVVSFILLKYFIV